MGPGGARLRDGSPEGTDGPHTRPQETPTITRPTDGRAGCTCACAGAITKRGFQAGEHFIHRRSQCQVLSQNKELCVPATMAAFPLPARSGHQTSKRNPSALPQ